MLRQIRKRLLWYRSLLHLLSAARSESQHMYYNTNKRSFKVSMCELKTKNTQYIFCKIYWVFFILSRSYATIHGDDATGHKAVGRRGHTANHMRDFLSTADTPQGIACFHVRQGVATVGIHQLTR